VGFLDLRTRLSKVEEAESRRDHKSNRRKSAEFSKILHESNLAEDVAGNGTLIELLGQHCRGLRTDGESYFCGSGTKWRSLVSFQSQIVFFSLCRIVPCVLQLDSDCVLSY
jgi:hypothetical protein